MSAVNIDSMAIAGAWRRNGIAGEYATLSAVGSACAEARHPIMTCGTRARSETTIASREVKGLVQLPVNADVTA